MDKNNSDSGKNKEISIDEALENLNSKMEETKKLNISKGDGKLFNNYINKDKAAVDDNYVDYFARVISEDAKRAETELKKIKEEEKTKAEEKIKEEEKIKAEEKTEEKSAEEEKEEPPEYVDYFKQALEEDIDETEEDLKTAEIEDDVFDGEPYETSEDEDADEEESSCHDHFSETREVKEEADDNKNEQTIRLVHSSSNSKKQKTSSTGRIKIVEPQTETKEESGVLDEEDSDVDETSDEEYESYFEEEVSEDYDDIFDEDDEYSKYYDLDYDDDDDYDDYDKKSRIIPVAVIILCLIAAVVVCFTNNTVNRGLKNMAVSFMSSIGLSDSIPQSLQTTNSMVEVDGSEAVEDIAYRTEVKSSVTVPIENADDSVFMSYGSGIVYAWANGLAYINDKGEKEWECETSIVNPIIYTEGSYIAVAEKNGNRICLYKNNKLVYDIPTDDDIQSVKVSANGDVIAVISRVSYKGGIVVYNNDGKLVFSWASGSDSVVSADISASSRRAAVTLLNSDSMPYSTVSMFNIKKEKSYSDTQFDNTIIFDLEFLGDDLNAFGDNSMIGMSSGGKVFFDKRFDDVELLKYSIDSFGNKLMLFESGNVPIMNVYNDNGRLGNTVYAKDLPTHIAIYKNRVLYNVGRNVILTSADSKKQYMYTANMDIKNIFLLNKSTFLLVYSNGVEIVRM